MERCISTDWPQEAPFTHVPSFYKGSLILPWPPHASTPFLVRGSPSLSSMEEARAMAASKSHSQAEKRRRERINTHLSTLRRLIPSANKMDKASLLGRVVDHVKDLKRKAAEISNVYTIPTEIDEVTIECDKDIAANNNSNNKKQSLSIKVSVCCEDRPELFSDLVRAIQDLRLRTVRAEMTTLGGRVRNVFILCTKDSEESVCLSSLKESLKAVLGRIVSSQTSDSTTFCRKRQRVLSLNCSDLSL